jgi:hypothetical protein
MMFLQTAVGGGGENSAPPTAGAGDKPPLCGGNCFCKENGGSGGFFQGLRPENKNILIIVKRLAPPARARRFNLLTP